MRRLFAFVVAMLIFSASLCSAQELGVGYYDLDGLYDTIPSRFYDDSPYSPNGRYNWSTERYTRKIRNTAAVIDSMALSVVALFGVENEGVVRDIVKACELDYTFIHSTRNSFDGQDFALLFFGDKLFVEGFDSITSGRNMLVVRATYSDDRAITLIFSISGDDTLSFLGDEVDPDEFVLVMGRLYQDEIEKMGYTNLLLESQRRGEGNYLAANGYVMHDRIATNQSEKILKSGVFITPWLLTPNKRSPLPTFDRDSYKGGYSKYLPVFTYIF